MITGLPINKPLDMDQIPAKLWKAGHENTSNELALLLDWILRIEACSLETTPPKCALAFLHQRSRKPSNSFSHLSSVAVHEEEERTEVTTLFPPLFATRGNTGAILFMDLSKSFDKFVRQVAFGAHGDINTMTDALLRSGVDSAAASHLAPIVASSGGLTTSAQSPCTHLQLDGPLHHQTWFQIEPRGKIIMTTRGSR